MSTYRYNVSLRVWHPSKDPALFTAALGLEPFHLDVVGQRRTRHGKTLDIAAKESYWTHQFDPAIETKDIEDFLLELASRLSQHKSFFAEICTTGGRAEFFVGFFPENFDCGFELSPTLQRQCATSISAYPLISMAIVRSRRMRPNNSFKPKPLRGSA